MSALAAALITGGLQLAAVADDAEPEVASNESAGPATSPVFTRRPYVALGAGLTELDPRSPTSALTVSDDSSTGFHGALGYDLFRWLSAELYFADLGEAEISFLDDEVGDVSYQVYGASAIAYLFNNRSGFSFQGGTDGLLRREGLSVYARGGIGRLINDSELDYRQDYSTHAVFGLGLEYGFSNGFAVRTELSGYDEDARYLSASLLKRFGQVSEAAPAAVAAVSPAVAPEPVAEEPTMFRPVPPTYVYFAFDESELTPEAIGKLDQFIDDFEESGLEIFVGGHADWIGSEPYNLNLSLRRAVAVQDYFNSRGIGSDRIRIQAYGESEPLSSNLTIEGRAENRRAEVRLQ